jgi:hypothetical protein
MEVTFDSRPCVQASVFLPRIGAWTADIESDDPAAPAATAMLVLDGALSLRGTVVRGGVEVDRWRGRIVGGAGGLQRDLPPAALRDTTLAAVLEEAVRAAGETLATGVSPAGSASRWHRVAAPAAHAVADVARAAGLSWRVLADGTLWMGVETWAPHRPLDVDLLDWRPELGRAELAGNTLGILPGQTLTVRDLTIRVGAVEHHAAREGLRTVVLAEPEVRPAGRMLDALSRLVAALTRRVDYLAHYPARVVQQRADGTLDLAPDDPRVPSCQAVPIRYGVPGLRAEVSAGARVTLTYEGGNPARPVATLWDTTTATIYVDGGTARAAREGHSVRVTIPTGAIVPAGPGGPLPAAPVTADGTITEGANALRIP